MAKDVSFEHIIADLSNVPDISGAWGCSSRKMYERNPGDGATKGIINVDPPDPRAPGGRMVIEVVQVGRTYTSSDVVNATHDHTTKGFYIGDGTFAFTTTRLAEVGSSFNDAAQPMTLNGRADLLDDGTLIITVVGAEGGNPAPHPDRDPPPGYLEVRRYRKIPAQSPRAL